MTKTETQPAAAGTDIRDAQLAAAGDARAFERLYRGHVARIHTLAIRMAGPNDAQELTQEIFVRAWDKLGSFRGDAAFGTWLYRLAINYILTYRQARATRRDRFQDDADLDTLPARPVPADHRMDFDTALAQLPPGARRILVLHDVEGYKHEEIADLLAITTGTSKAQLHRARMLMRAVLHA